MRKQSQYLVRWDQPGTYGELSESPGLLGYCAFHGRRETGSA